MPNNFSPVPEGMVPLYRYVDQRGVHLLSRFPSLQDFTLETNQCPEGIQCYVHASPVPGTVPLYSYWRGDIRVGLLSSNWGELGWGPGAWELDPSYPGGIIGYVYPVQTTGMVPLFRYYNHSNEDHFYTTKWQELRDGASGWEFEEDRPTGWVYPTPAAIGPGGSIGSVVVTSSPTDYSPTTNDIIRSSVLTVLGFVPKGGKVVSTLVRVFWPSSEPNRNVWEEVKDLVVQEIQAAIQKQVYIDRQATLQGIYNLIETYKQDISTEASTVTARWIDAEGEVNSSIPSFTQTDHQVALLPLYAQLVNFHLLLLRDGISLSEANNENPATIEAAKNKLANCCDKYVSYATTTYTNGLAAIDPNDWIGRNRYTREMTLGVMDFCYLWPYFKLGGSMPSCPVGEIYSDPVGFGGTSTFDGSPAPTQDINEINILSQTDGIPGIQVSYPGGGGPGGVDCQQTNAPLDLSTARNQYPGGGSIEWVKVNNLLPIDTVLVTGCITLWSLQFGYKDGTWSDLYGGSGWWRERFYSVENDGWKHNFGHATQPRFANFDDASRAQEAGGPQFYNLHFPGRILSSIRQVRGGVPGVEGTNCTVFGFKMDAEAWENKIVPLNP